MDDSNAPTDCAINNRHRGGGGVETDVSVLTSEALREEQDFTAGFVTLSGRDEQMTNLREAYERATAGFSELVLVDGESGTGKTSLVDSMREIVTQNNGGHFVSGKFDQLQTRKEPFSAIAAALSDLCDLIVQSRQIDDKRREIVDAFGSSSIKCLSKVVTNATQLMTDGSDDQETMSVHRENFDHFRHACQLFLRSVVSPSQPLLLFLDDLQWADDLSVELIHALITDPDSKSILFCVAYRGSEVDGKARLCLDSIEDSSGSVSSAHKQHKMPLTQVSVTNLDRDSLASMLTQLLHMEKASLGTLTDLLFQKTKGNPNAAIQVLQLLKSKQMLTLSNETLSWEWNMQAITSEVSDNSEEILAKQIAALDCHAQEAILMAAYVGHTFCSKVLKEILFEPVLRPDATSLTNDEKVALTKGYLSDCIETGLIEAKGGVVYKFGHDSIQHYVYHLVGEESERSKLHLRIGRVVMRMINAGEDACYKCSDNLVFLATANMINGARYIVEDVERLKTMKLCLEAATLAVKKSSTLEAKEYLHCAVSLHKNEDWKSSHQIVVDIYNGYAEILSYTGCYDECDKAVDTVLRHATDFLNRDRASTTKLRTLIYRHDYNGAVKWAFNNCMAGQDVAMVENPSSGRVALALLLTKRAMQKIRPNDFLSFPHTSDEHILATMRTLTILYKFAYAMKRRNMYLYSVLNCIRLSIKYGICEWTAQALSGYAMALRLMGKVDDACQLGQVAMKMAESFESADAKANGWAISAMFLEPFRKPFFEGLQSCVAGYKYGLKDGSDLHIASLCLLTYSEYRLITGAPILELEKELRNICQLMKGWDAKELRNHTLIFWQYVLNLLGRSDDPLLLRGDAVDEGTYAELMDTKEEITFQKCAMQMYSFSIKLLFEDWEGVKECLPSMSKITEIMRGHFMEFICLTNCGMASLALLEKTGERRYIKVARKYIKAVKRFADDSVPDTKPLLLLLQAEWSAIVEKQNDDRKKFEAAIQDLKTHKLVYFETMAYQRAMHSMMRRYHTRDAQAYLAKGISRHRTWGTLAMIEFLQAEHADVLRCIKPTYEIKVTNRLSSWDGP